MDPLFHVTVQSGRHIDSELTYRYSSNLLFNKYNQISYLRVPLICRILLRVPVASREVYSDFTGARLREKAVEVFGKI